MFSCYFAGLTDETRPCSCEVFPHNFTQQEIKMNIAEFYCAKPSIRTAPQPHIAWSYHCPQGGSLNRTH